MRLLYMHHGYYPLLAGAEAMAYHTAQLMCHRGHTIQFVCQSRSRAIERRWLAGIEIIAVPDLDATRLSTMLGAAPDIIHVIDAVWPEYLQVAGDLARRWGSPLAITPASAMGTWPEAEVTLAICRQAQAVFVLTQAERAVFVQHGIPAEVLRVIGQAPHLLGSPDPTGFRRRHSIAGPMVLFLGRKIHFKGYRQLLDAAPLVWAHFPDTHFVFVGPRYDPDCTALFAAAADPRIVEIDIIDDYEKHSALAACELLCLPTTTDVFPLVVCEAWACGKPVIVGPFSGATEIIRHGEDGLIVAATPAAIAAGVGQLLGSAAQRQTMGATGQVRVHNELNWEVVIDRIEGTYTTMTRDHILVDG